MGRLDASYFILYGESLIKLNKARLKESNGPWLEQPADRLDGGALAGGDWVII
jgi:hypothetical protein